MNQSKICTTCGTYYPAEQAPELCITCLDERQYIPATGQGWTTPEQLIRDHSIKVKKLQENLYELEINPMFAIGQRALLILSPNGNVLWDCIPLLDELTIEFIKSKGGLKAIGVSHPHYYSNMNEWAETFDCPVYIHEKDGECIVHRERHIQLWQGDEVALWDGMRIINIGGHFAGSSIIHIPLLSRQGTIICGDTLFLSPGKKHFSVMYSYPNRMPLSLHEMQRIKNRFGSIDFDAFYGYQNLQNLTENVKEIFSESMKRYC